MVIQVRTIILGVSNPYRTLCLAIVQAVSIVDLIPGPISSKSGPFLTITMRFIGMFGMMSHNYRIYGTALLLLELVIVALGVKFVQLLAPVSRPSLSSFIRLLHPATNGPGRMWRVLEGFARMPRDYLVRITHPTNAV